MQKFPQPSEDEAQVVAYGAHDSVDLVAETAFEEVPPQVAVDFVVADDGLDGRAAAVFSFDLTKDAAFLP